MSHTLTRPYVGRFAPSPSGALHFGSLIAALGSYLRAKSQQGQWLIRIEDIDPPREVAGAADEILRTLDAFGLHWDQSVIYQSQRHQAYEQVLSQLLDTNKGYYCQCTRKQIKAIGGVYQGHCLPLSLTKGAIRLQNQSAIQTFEDLNLGQIQTSETFAAEDFILKRSDGLYAYQLAVVLDDAAQGITEVVRGADLLEATVRQLSLYQTLGFNAPQWLHLPLACADVGFKLSKQNHAPAVDAKQPQPAIQAALQFLGQAPVIEDRVELMLAQAVAQFSLATIPKQREILLTSKEETNG